jgi:vacuolar-type H+-ATPase subunit E/Vma4
LLVLRRSCSREQKLETKNLRLKKLSIPPPKKKKRKNVYSAGGVLARTPDGRISCSNTLDARLAIAYAQKLPEIRAALFGEA